jgi:hypothetical protein
MVKVLCCGDLDLVGWCWKILGLVPCNFVIWLGQGTAQRAENYPGCLFIWVLLLHICRGFTISFFQSSLVI